MTFNHTAISILLCTCNEEKDKYSSKKSPKLKMGWLCSIQLQKEEKLVQISQAVKKSCVALREAIVKKDVKSKWQSRNSCDGLW